MPGPPSPYALQQRKKTISGFGWQAINEQTTYGANVTQNTIMKKDLTEKQNRILKFIIKFHEENGYPPTVREIGGRFKIASSSVFDHLNALARKGYINKEGHRSRGLGIINSAATAIRQAVESMVEVPILGQVQAGVPVMSEENFEGTVTVSRDIVKSGDYFALRVKGDSMEGAGILEGDILITRQQQTIEENDVVVALVDNEATVKRFKRSKKGPYLKPENPAYIDIPLGENSSILGKVTALLRKY